jgi:hypothetical protein
MINEKTAFGILLHRSVRAIENRASPLARGEMNKVEGR